MRPAGEADLARRAAIRLGLLAGVLVGVLVVALTTAAVIVVLAAQRTQVASVLSTTIAQADDVGDPPPGVYLVLRAPDGRLSTTPGLPGGVEDPAALVAATPTTTERDVGGVDYAVSTARRDDGVTVQAILDLTADHTARDGLVAAMLATGVVGLLLAAAVGTWLGHRALAPLSAALALQRRFVTDAGHELRTPLTLLATRAQLLRRRLRRYPDADPDALAEADGVVADSNRLAAVMEDLLLAADPFAERPRARVDVSALCRDAVAAAGADARARDVDLRLDVPGPLLVAGSAPALLRAVTALVENAVRHARAVVEVTGTDGAWVVVDVRDDGDGVDPAVVPRLFDRFSSGDRHAVPAPTPGPRRYGLGLALVAEIAAAHDGRVEPVSADPAAPGAVFRLVLPAVAPRKL